MLTKSMRKKQNKIFIQVFIENGNESQTQKLVKFSNVRNDSKWIPNQYFSPNKYLFQDFDLKKCK
jgi:hypothetical protein